MRLYIVRHADPDYENNTITPEGHMEAKALAKRFQREGLDYIYSSPKGRAIHTMQYTAQALGVEAEILEWTREYEDWFIELERHGRMVAWQIPGEHIRSELPLVMSGSWHNLTDIKGHTQILHRYNETVTASDLFLKKHGYERFGGKYRCIKPNRSKIAVFCHKGFGLTWLAHLLEIPPPLVWSGFWLPPSSVTTVLFDERSEEWAVPRCLGLGDVSHLYEANLPVRPRGIRANFY